MEKVHRILILEDVQADAEMEERELRNAGISFSSKVVSIRKDFIRELADFSPDIVLADYKLPSFDGLSALKIVKEECPDIPFVFVTGAMGEEWAVEALNKGATDYVLKDRLDRLVPVIRRALAEMEQRVQHKRMEEALKDSEERFRSVAENASDAIICLEAPDTIYFWNKKAEEMFGYLAYEVVGKEMHGLIVPERHREKASEGLKSFFQTGTGPVVGKTIELSALRKDGTEFPIELSVSAMKIRGRWQSTGIIRDITERKEVEKREKILYAYSQNVVANLDPDSMFREMCQAVVQMGHRMAWIGLLNEATKDVVPKGQAGFEEGYLSSIKVKYDDSPLGTGPTGMGIKNKHAVVQNHIATDPIYAPWRDAALKRGYRSSVAFPIIDKDEVVGVLNVYNVRDEFPKRDVEFLQTFANNAASFIRNAQLIEEVKKSAEKIKQEMEVTSHLLMIAEATAHTADIDKLMEQAVHCVYKILKCDICLSYLWDRALQVFYPMQAYGLDHRMSPIFRTEPLVKTVGFVRRAMEIREPVVEKFGVGGLELSWIKGIDTLAIIPLTVRKEPLGLIIGIYQRSREFDEREKMVMHGISNQISTAVEQARLYRDSVERGMELSYKMETIQLMHEIDRSILSTLKPQEILETVTRMVGRIVPCERATVVLVDREGRRFDVAAGFGLKEDRIRETSIPFEDTNATEVVETGIPQYLANLMEMEYLPPFERRLAEIGIRSYLRLPLITKGEVTAILLAGSSRPSAFTPEDLSTLEKIAAQIGVALENARLIKDLEELFMGIVKSLSSAIDAKSPWTAGHSGRVTKYALQIGKEMGLSDKELKELELAGFLHDVGKIGIYEDILDKPDVLTEEELVIMRRHPAKGAEILAPIKQLKDIIPAIRHHQEFYDGTGYPDGLKGEGIPLSARIIGVADTIDAMSADRPYRNGKPMDIVLEELKSSSGTQFDPKVVEAFLKALGQG